MKGRRSRRTKQQQARARAPESQTGQGPVVEVLIERIVPGGAGIAHADGRTIFVGLAAPGDRLRVRLNRIRGQIAFASIVEVIEPSRQRIEPPCPYFGRCGGCDFQQLSYEAQLEAKVALIGDCLRRIARITQPLEIPIEASPAAWHYRSRAQWQYDPERRLLGYFERGSHNVCDVSECPVLVPALQEALSGLREMARDRSLPNATEFQSVAGDEGAALSPPVGPGFKRETSRRIGEWRYLFSADGFFQINHSLLPSLIRTALGSARGHRAIDLYCGVGLFTLPLSARFTHVVGIEASDTAIRYARSNLQATGPSAPTDVTFECARVSDWLKSGGSSLSPVDFLLLDPPRTGVEEGVTDDILALRPRRISYVSCDPATLARDLKHLIAGGYRLDSVHAFDMFPQTHHVETIALLVRQ